VLGIAKFTGKRALPAARSVVVFKLDFGGGLLAFRQRENQLKSVSEQHHPRQASPLLFLVHIDEDFFKPAMLSPEILKKEQDRSALSGIAINRGQHHNSHVSYIADCTAPSKNANENNDLELGHSTTCTRAYGHTHGEPGFKCGVQHPPLRSFGSPR
jgi:hypothetical protein